MVLVDNYRNGACNLDSFQNEIYEVVEQMPAGKERPHAREMGG